MEADPTFLLYNSLSRKVEPLAPAEKDHLRLYACGPTVYSHAHIGNFRTFVTVDLILRTAHAIGWDSTYVTNVTDVGHLTDDDLADPEGEDKMEKALRSSGGLRFRNIWDLASYYEQSVLEDWRSIGLLEPDVRPRATQHIREQILAIKRLVESGHAYETDKGVYFSVPSFPNYGKLSGNEAAENLEVLSRELVTDPQKRDPRDFALWKKDPKHLMQWYSPWGWGYPGWHIECSVMATAYLGDSFDVHAGGEDLRFPHHECEIAQAESLSGKPFAKHWVHTRFLRVEGEKMSKSGGNQLTLKDLTAREDEGGKGFDPMAVRYALLSGHYRKPLNFTLKNLKDSAKAIERFRSLRQNLVPSDASDQAEVALTDPDLRSAYDKALSALLEDLNTPVALAAALEGVKVLEARAVDKDTSLQAWAYLNKIDALLGLLGKSAAADRHVDEAGSEFAATVEELIEKRAEARAERNWSTADAIRDDLESLGVTVEDTPDGPVWRKK